jgi:hypothetical protein
MSEATPLWSKGPQGADKLIPEEVTFMDEDGAEVPLYHFFLESDSGIAVNTEEARMRLSDLIAQSPDLVLRCQGKTRAEVQKIFAH